ncbi:MAG TPA: ribulose-phosphate 3-epimerase [Spirochaetes bacterium]|nr:ribulose-phosphate 3-epimerase [Spirochaetota bacterium]
MTSRDGVLISPSIIATDLSTLGTAVSSFDPGTVDLLHVDVMDGHFVPNLTIGPGYIDCLKTHTDIPLDVHLMIDNPDSAAAAYIERKPWCVTFHCESTRFPVRLLRSAAEAGIKPGLSINPATPVDTLYDLAPYCGLILVMSVEPGFYGQAFLDHSLRRIEKLREFLEQNGLGEHCLIQVDGGINERNIASVVMAGARIVVAGSAAFTGGDINKNVARLKKSAMERPAQG